jgi:phage-related protein
MEQLALPEDIKCGAVTVDVALEPSIAAYKSAIQEIGATICEVAKRQNAKIDAVTGDARTYSDAANQAILTVIQELTDRVDALPTTTGGITDAAPILAAAKAEAEALIAAAMEFTPEAKAELQILLTLIQEAPELRNIAGVIAEQNALKERVAALEAAQFTAADVDCRAISIAVRLADSITEAMQGFRLGVMNCAYPQPSTPLVN